MTNGGGRHSFNKEDQPKPKKLKTKKQKEAKDRLKKEKPAAK